MLPFVTESQCEKRTSKILDAVKEVGTEVKNLRVSVESHVSIHKGREGVRRSLARWIGVVIGVSGATVAAVKLFL